MASLSPRPGKLGKRLAAHLLRRCCYRFTKERVDSLSQMTANRAIQTLLKPLPTPTIPEPYRINKANNLSWWMHQALLDTTLNHKMAFFLHTLFVADFMAMQGFNFQHLRLLNLYATGNIRDFAKKMSVDNRMVRYLDATFSSKGNPNENYAREFLELFSIGKGPQIGPGDYTHYTEYDVQQAARIFTGFRIDGAMANIDPDTGLPRANANISEHDTGNKIFSSKFGGKRIIGSNSAAGMYREVNDFVDMVFNQEETARFICRKLYRYFINTEISTEIENDIIIPLGQTLKSNNYELMPTLNRLLKSKHFYDTDDANKNNETIGGMFKSPLELVLGSLSFFDIDIPDPIAQQTQHYNTFYRDSVQNVMFSKAGFFLFQPSSVAGYQAYHQQPDYHRNWFTASSLIARYKLPEMLISGNRVLSEGDMGGVLLDAVKYVENPANISNPEDATIVVRELLEYLLPENADTDRFDYFLQQVFLNGLSPLNWMFEWRGYQASDDPSDVKIPLDRLITAIMHSPEYQLM
ncbi:MAG: DUF1800 family protein [Bacteroidota bacterium]